MSLRSIRIGFVCAALALATGLTGCVVERPPAAEVVAPYRPPAPRVEVIPPAPRPPEVVVWQPGHWRWDGREYVWVAGAWVERPHREAHWVPGHWVERPNGRWVWIEGRWR